ncbi:MAG: EAL domain-containing protein [Candidatus Sedimenticola sp. (ex Thyasira tokunagai)]
MISEGHRHQQEIRADQVSMLYQGIGTSVLVTLAVALIFTYIHSSHDHPKILYGWLATLTIIMLIRGGVGYYFLHHVSPGADYKAWRWRFRVGVWSAGIIWGLAGLLFYPSEQVAYQTFTVLVLAGLAAGAITVLAADFPSFLGYTGFALLPIALISLWQGDTLHVGMGTLVIALLAFLQRAARNLSKSFITSLRLRYENRALVTQLAEEKDHLDNRLGRILNNSSSEIYIFDADSLCCLQANAGAAQNLGYSPLELEGKRIQDILVEMSSSNFKQLVEPLLTQEQEYITLSGYHQRSDSSTYPVEAQIQLSELEHPPVFVVTVLDLTQREKAERTVREKQAMIHSVLSSAPVVLWALDTQGNFTFTDAGSTQNPRNFIRAKPGDNIFTTYAGTPQIVNEAHRALAGESFRSDLELNDSAYEIRYTPQIEDGHLIGAIGVALNITERKEHERELIRQANYDELTGLPNKSYMMLLITEAFNRAKRKQEKVALIYIDLDHFKNINDTMGHRAGDELLKQAAGRICNRLREVDTAARLSGDEFLVMAEGLKQDENAGVVARKLSRAFKQPYTVNSREIYTSVSIGISLFPSDSESADQLLQYADTAMYQVKANDRNGYQFFTRAMRTAAEGRMTLESHLHRALEHRELSVVYQPKIDATNGQILGAEALLRWNSEALGFIPPDQFIPIAEDSGLIESIGAWVLEEACAEAKGWHALCDRSLHVAVNVSSRQFRSNRLLDTVERALRISGLSAAALEIEITESLLVQDAPKTLEILNQLQRRGVRLSLDDFGTGYSSLSYLKRFPLQILKIDRSFVSDLSEKGDNQTLVDAIIAMAHSLNLQVVAEGVENHQQLAYMKERGVAQIQGYLFSPPVTAEVFRAMLTGERPLLATVTQEETQTDTAPHLGPKNLNS